MAIQKDSIIDQIEVTSSGDVQLRIKLMIVDGTDVLASRWHRTIVPAGTDPAAQVAAVNAHLSVMGESPIQAEDIARLVAICSAERATAGRKEFAKSLIKKDPQIPLAGQKV